ncbi:polysaccharide lyase family 7 protein [Paraburkholderia fungorum]|uniref:polysaccharide lyase family 7 protein n=1 Tax=Paraburkholderia fungorum TaxID=134537 RepID=UPI0011C4085F|nr:polysaccharide lyase family 7 protein [Paraburkholderia fungorum]
MDDFVFISRYQPMSCKRFAFIFMSAVIWAGAAHAQVLDPALAPGQNFDLSAYRLQTLDARLQFKEISPVGMYQDPFFSTDPATGEMTFRVPSGAGHSRDSEFPRVELRENDSWTMQPSGGPRHIESFVLRVLAEPSTGELIFAQIHGEKTGGSEALKMRWSHGDILMGVKKRYGVNEEKILLLRGVSLGDTIECQLAFENDTLAVHIRSGAAEMTRRFRYAIDSWKGIPLYFKVGNYSGDKDSDGSFGRVAIQRLALTR